MSRIILHSDCNSFYASVEKALDPKLKDKPVAVSGNAKERHGIILAKSIEAQRYGVKTGEPIWQAKQKCPQLITLLPNFEKYIEYSKIAREIYYSYSDQVEPFGLDEAWIDVTGSRLLFGDGLEIAKSISHKIKSELNITVSIGVSYNKVFAKLGSDYKKPDAITVITKENYKDIVWPLPVESLLYVGRSTKKKLYNLGIKTIGNIAATSNTVLRNNLGKQGDILYNYANGLDCSPVAIYNNNPTVKSIGNSTTTPRDLKTLEDVKIVFCALAENVAMRMRKQGFLGKTVTISVKDNSLSAFTRQKQMPRYSNVTSEIMKCAMEIFKESYNWNRNIRSLGISVSDFCSENTEIQLSFFNDEERHIKQEKLDLTNDKLKNKFGKYIITPALLMIDKSIAKLDPHAVMS